MIREFYKGKRVFVTGHTGFKGSWLCKMLSYLGAEVTGYALHPDGTENLYEIAEIEKNIKSYYGDIRDIETLEKAISEAHPEIVIHMAAQPIVRVAYQKPVYTYETNVMGTVNLLECIRNTECVKSFLNVTTDKVYENKEWDWGYREIDALDGYDPYSNSKSCSELVTHSYAQSFFQNREIAISTVRAGNVLGGGDFSVDRIIPDCIRATREQRTIIVRNPYSTRPYQHVLDALYAYMTIMANQYQDKSLAGNYNVGPDDRDCFQTGALVDLFVKTWGNQATWKDESEANAPHEAGFLKLDCSKMKKTFSWQPRWNLEKTVEKTVEWTKSWLAGENVRACMERQIAEFLGI